MSHSQFHCTGRAYLDMHGLIFETSICYWQDQPGRERVQAKPEPDPAEERRSNGERARERERKKRGEGGRRRRWRQGRKEGRKGTEKEARGAGPPDRRAQSRHLTDHNQTNQPTRRQQHTIQTLPPPHFSFLLSHPPSPPRASLHGAWQASGEPSTSRAARATGSGNTGCVGWGERKNDDDDLRREPAGATIHRNHHNS